MKRILVFALCMLVVFSLVCCKSEEKDNEQSSSANIAAPEKADNTVNQDKKETEKKEESLFESTSFLNAFAQAIGKESENVTAADAEAVHYIAISKAEDGSFELSIADKDAADLLFNRQFDEFTARIKNAKCNFGENENLATDLGLFKNVEMFEFVDFPMTDVSFVNKYGILSVGVFNNNGITDVSALADYNPESLVELDFTDNNIADWSPLEHIKEKVLVFYDLNSGFSCTLQNYLDQKENPVVETPSAETETPTGTDEAPMFVDENGNPVDFSSLFD